MPDKDSASVCDVCEGTGVFIAEKEGGPADGYFVIEACDSCDLLETDEDAFNYVGLEIYGYIIRGN